MRSKQNDADMTQGVIWKHFVRFTLPMVLGLLFQQLYNTVDTLVVGQFVGTEALAAVGSTTSIVNMLVGLSAGLSTGASVVISQRYGAHDTNGLHDAVQTTIAVTLILCAIFTAIGIAIVQPMLNMMSTPEEVFGEAETYLTIYFSGIAGLLIYNMGSGILRAVGDSRHPLYFLVFSALMNTVMDLLFVVVFKMGVAGVAWATIIAQFCSAILVLYTLSQDSVPYGIKWKSLRIRKDMLKEILSIGLPSGVQQGLTSFSNVFVQSYINAFGAACMAGYSSYNKLDAFILIPAQAISMASTTFVGQNWGANKPERARKGMWQALGMSLASTIVLTLGMLLLARPLIRFFSPDEDVISYGVRFITIMTPFYFVISFYQIFAGALRGIGSATAPMVIMLGSFVVFRQIYLYVAQQAGLGFVGVALGYPMGWIVCSLSLSIAYARSKLAKKHCAPSAG